MKEGLLSEKSAFDDCWREGFRMICKRKLADSDMTCEELANEMGVSAQYFSNMMNGRRPINKRREHQLAQLLGIDLLRAFIAIEFLHKPHEYEEPMIVFATSLCCAVLDKAQHLQAAREGRYIATVSPNQLESVAERSIASLMSHSDVIAQRRSAQVA